MSIKIDRVQLDIVINNDQARVQLQKLEAEYKSLSAEQKQYTKGSADWERVRVAMLANRAAMDKVVDSIGIANMTLRELTKRSQELTLMRSHLRPGTEEFAKIDKELTQVNSRMSELRGKSNATGKALSGMNFSGVAGMISKVGSVIGIVIGAFNTLKGTINLTDTVSDAFNETIGGLKSSIEYFGRSLLNMDFSNFFKNIREAIRIGKEYVSTLDAIGDRTRGLSIVRADDAKRIAQLDIISKDVNRTKKERIDALNEILHIEQTNADLSLGIAKDREKNELKNAAFQTGLSEKRIRELLKENATRYSSVESAKKYIEAVQVLGKQSMSKGSNPIVALFLEDKKAIDEAKKTIQSVSPEIKKNADELLKLGKIGENSYEKLTSAIVESGQTEASYYQENQKRITRQNKLNKGILDDEEELTKNTIKNNEKKLSSLEKLQAEISKLNKELIDMLLAGKTPPDEFLSNLKKMEQKVIDVNNAVAVSKNGLESYIKLSPDVVIPDEPIKPDTDETIIGDYIDTDYYAKQTELYQQLNDRKLDLVQQGIDGAKNLLMAASQAQYQHDVNLMNQKYDKEKQKLEDQLNSNAISREVYDKKVAALDKKRSAEDLKLRRKQAIREKEIATLGIGVDTAKAIFEIKAKAAAFLAGVTTAPLAAVALAQIPWVLGAAALQTGLVWAQPMPQAYMGKNLNVTGASDGRLYKNVPYAGDAKTGMYRHPTLIADHGSEIVIDHFRSRNITMNYPEILEAIRAVPQHYSGRVPEASYSNNTVSLALSAELIAAMNRFTAAALKLDKDGVELNYQKLTDLQEKVQNIESLTSF